MVVNNTEYHTLYVSIQSGYSNPKYCISCNFELS